MNLNEWNILCITSVKGMSDFHLIFSCLRGRFLVEDPDPLPSPLDDVESLKAEGRRLPALRLSVPTHPPMTMPSPSRTTTTVSSE